MVSWAFTASTCRGYHSPHSYLHDEAFDCTSIITGDPIPQRPNQGWNRLETHHECRLISPSVHQSISPSNKRMVPRETTLLVIYEMIERRGEK